MREQYGVNNFKRQEDSSANDNGSPIANRGMDKLGKLTLALESNQKLAKRKS